MKNNLLIFVVGVLIGNANASTVPNYAVNPQMGQSQLQTVQSVQAAQQTQQTAQSDQNQIKPKSFCGNLSSSLGQAVNGTRNFAADVIKEAAPEYKKVLTAELLGRPYYPDYYTGGYNNQIPLQQQQQVPAYSNIYTNTYSPYGYTNPYASTAMANTTGTVGNVNVPSLATMASGMPAVSSEESPVISCSIVNKSASTGPITTGPQLQEQQPTELQQQPTELKTTQPQPQTHPVTESLVNRRGPFSYPQIFLENLDEKPIPPPKSANFGFSL